MCKFMQGIVAGVLACSIIAQADIVQIPMGDSKIDDLMESQLEVLFRYGDNATGDPADRRWEVAFMDPYLKDKSLYPDHTSYEENDIVTGTAREFVWEDGTPINYTLTTTESSMDLELFDVDGNELCQKITVNDAAYNYDFNMIGVLNLTSGTTFDEADARDGALTHDIFGAGDMQTVTTATEPLIPKYDADGNITGYKKKADALYGNTEGFTGSTISGTVAFSWGDYEPNDGIERYRMKSYLKFGTGEFTVPEPSTISLASLGFFWLVGLAGFRKRKK